MRILIPEFSENIRELVGKDRQIVFTNGCFDLLHIGHIALLQYAKFAFLGTTPEAFVVVGVNDDASVRQMKGKDRPIFPLTDRVANLSAIKYVDYVIPFYGQDQLLPLIESVRPNGLLKGGDWKGNIVGKDFVQSYGGKVGVFPYIEGYSSTEIIQRLSGTTPIPKKFWQRNIKKEK